jgi:hypothetical protein
MEHRPDRLAGRETTRTPRRGTPAAARRDDRVQDMVTRYTEQEFEQLGWHDCTIWGVELHPADPDAGDWSADLALDIDFIVEWLCPVTSSGRTEFRVAPATLLFQGVSDLSIMIAWGNRGVGLHEMSIAAIEWEPVPTAPPGPGRPAFRWRIKLNWPKSGEITFEAEGFTQTLRADPVVTDQQSLSRRVRSRLAPPPSEPPA